MTPKGLEPVWNQKGTGEQEKDPLSGKGLPRTTRTFIAIIRQVRREPDLQAQEQGHQGRKETQSHQRTGHRHQDRQTRPLNPG